MHKFVFLILTFIFLNNLQCFALEEDFVVPNIFIYKMPDEIDEEVVVEKKVKFKKKSKEDQEKKEQVELQKHIEENEIPLNVTTLKGYAEYSESDGAIALINDEEFALNLKVPQPINREEERVFKKTYYYDHFGSRHKYESYEHRVVDESSSAKVNTGDFTVGTNFANEIDSIAMRESSTSLFTRYEKSKFAVSTSFSKTMNTTINRYSDSIKLTPEYRINQYLKYRQVLGVDLTRDRQSNEFILSISPFGQKKEERLLFEVGAKQTIMGDGEPLRTRFNFTTRFKL